jgi:hypothetical protein
VDPIKFEGTTDEALFEKAQLLHLGRRSPTLLMLFPLITTIVTGVVLYLGVDNWDGTTLNTLIFAAVFSFLFSFLTPRISSRVWKWIHRNSPYMKRSFTGKVLDEGLEIVDRTSSALTPWEDYIHTKEWPDLVLLFMGPTLFHIVAKEFFASEEDWQAAVKKIRESVVKKK